MGLQETRSLVAETVAKVMESAEKRREENPPSPKKSNSTQVYPTHSGPHWRQAKRADW